MLKSVKSLRLCAACAWRMVAAQRMRNPCMAGHGARASWDRDVPSRVLSPAVLGWGRDWIRERIKGLGTRKRGRSNVLSHIDGDETNID